MSSVVNEKVSIETWRQYKDNPDTQLRNEIVIAYSGLVKSIVRRALAISGSYVDAEDLISYGMIGLIRAVEKYDTSKGVAFETFATYRIRGEIIDYMRRNDWVPRGVRKRAQELENVTNEIKNEIGREPTEEELSQKLGIKRSSLSQTLSDMGRFSLMSFEELIQDTVRLDTDFASDETPESSLQESETLEMLAKAIDGLSERERLVITLYYYEELTLREISEIMGVSESRVSQLHTQAVGNLKKTLHSY